MSGTFLGMSGGLAPRNVAPSVSTDAYPQRIFHRSFQQRRGRWLIVVYDQSFTSQPTRPFFQSRRDDGSTLGTILPAATFGRAEWIGYIAAEFPEVEILIYEAQASDFRIQYAEELGLLSLQPYLWRRGSRQLGRFWAYDWLRSFGNRTKRIPFVPDHYSLLRFDHLSAKRSRRVEINSFDRIPHYSNQESQIEFLIDATDARAAQKLTRTVASFRTQPDIGWRATIATQTGSSQSVSSSIGHLTEEQSFQIVEFAPDMSKAKILRNMIEKAQGQSIGFLESGDCLAAEAMVAVLSHFTGPDAPSMIYSDNTWHDVFSGRTIPQLKPDWSPEYFRNADYVGGLWFFETKLAKSVATSVSTGENEFVYSLAAAMAERINPNQIVHVKRPLLCRELAFLSKPKAAPDRRLSSPTPKVSIIIPTRDRVDLLRNTIGTLRENTSYGDYEIIVVDNGSEEPATVAYLKDLHTQAIAKVVDDRGDFNFPRLINCAASQATGDVFVFLNNDTIIVEASWLAELVRLAVKPGVGAVGANLLYPNGTIQHAGVVLGLGGRAGHIFRGRPGDFMDHLGRLAVAHEVSAVTAACLAITRKNFVMVGGFDTSFAVDFNDLDFCLRLRRMGLRNLWTPHATVVHVESASRVGAIGRRSARFRAEAANFTKRWQAEVLNDPFFHPALALRISDEMLE